MTPPFPTSIDDAAEGFDSDDEVLTLREWGADTVYALPKAPVQHCTIGASARCSVRLDDPSGKVEGLHAQLTRDRSRWLLRDLSRRSCVWLDGVRRTHVVLEPGLEIALGGLTLVAESRRTIGLRDFVCRLIGWRRDRLEAVDLALRSLRMAAARRGALVLCGAGDLVPIAQSLHHRVFGADRPFVLCDPRRRHGKATVRSAENYKDGALALVAATGGSLCVRALCLPSRFDEITAALRGPHSRAQLVICAQSPTYCEPFLATPIVVPSLVDRADELDQIITEYAKDAYIQFGIRRAKLQPSDHDWVRRCATSGLPEIEKTTLRLVALRTTENVARAAARLGTTPTSLARWFQGRGLPRETAPCPALATNHASTHEGGNDDGNNQRISE